MSVLMVRSRVKAESAAELEAAAKAMFSEIEEAQPRGVSYASCRLPDGVTYVAWLELEDPANNPLVSLPAFKAFQDNLKNWIAEPPVPEPLTVIGSYQLF